jgi:hypothetical protein
MQSVALTDGDACFENLQTLDRKLARAARISGPLRFALGVGLNALAACGGHAALGFSTLEDYGRERCEYGATALGQARRLAVRASALPRLREALNHPPGCSAASSGRISWSMAKEIARVATPENEEKLLQLAAHRTVGRMKDLLAAEVTRNERIEPPDSNVVADLKALETQVVTGAVFRDDAPGHKSATETVAAVEAAFHAARHTPRHLRSLGRDTIRLRIEPEIRAAYRGLERLFERHRPIAMTFLRFACQAEDFSCRRLLKLLRPARPENSERPDSPGIPVGPGLTCRS